MAKLTLADVANLMGNPTSAANTINANNALVEIALENTLSRDGTTPNQMEADIDMNNNDILNVDSLDVETLSADVLIINGGVVTPGDLVILDSAHVSPMHYGAVGDGVADDTVPVLSAFMSGLPVDAAHREFAVSGNLELTNIDNLDIRNIKLKQLDHNASGRKTLHLVNCEKIYFSRVVIDRNGDGTGGSLASAAGIWINGGGGHLIEDCEVFGADHGSGIVFDSTNEWKCVRPFIHDITYTAAVIPPDDLCQGLWVNACESFAIDHPRITRVGGIVAGNFRRAFGRMLPIGLGSRDFTITGGNLSDGDVGLDLTGSIGCHRFTVQGMVVEDVETWGIKVSNYNRFGKILGCHVYRAGSAGFVGSGPTVNVDPDTATPEMLPQMVDFIGCGAWDTGFGNTGRGTSQPAGFLIAEGAATNFKDYPRGYRFIDCDAVDNQAVKTQYHGFRNDIIYGGPPLNEAIGCRSDGYVVGGGHSSGMHYPAASVHRTAAQTLTNATETLINFTATDVFDGAAMHNTVTNNDIVFVPRPGYWKIESAIRFDDNATGQRVTQIFVGGVAQADMIAVMPGNASGDTTVILSGIVYIGDVSGGISIKAQQNSGGNLDVMNARMTVYEAMPYSS